ncbi:RusA family crossover junction endodeoxyribonuclease [Clostridium sp.]|uniref:RusA family crossover junction endodeoxyribonuclease n=1 Tax=Clostridium sp. TaxID=1506 RepID=UPI002841CE43|nr:RusA family crossover junction endodeoxyribonuclease [Clostridium sp.]MDR3598428.1 RusA family crossover junction endodeoxyribonuclease [Clostridium sp.]
MVVVEGTIKAKARPRFNTKTGHAVTPKDTVTYENWVKICYQQQDRKHTDGPVRATINIYYKVPKSYTKKRLKAIREGIDYPCKKPDADNVAKIILDSLNKIAYDDDSQVVKLIVNKLWTEDTERVEFELKEV